MSEDTDIVRIDENSMPRRKRETRCHLIQLHKNRIGRWTWAEEMRFDSAYDNWTTTPSKLRDEFNLRPGIVSQLLFRKHFRG